MRQFDMLNTYFDDSGKPLSGRLAFYDINSQPCNVYDVYGTNLGNKIGLNNAGRLRVQVFLEDKDYLIDFQKKVGNIWQSLHMAVNRMPRPVDSGESPSAVIEAVQTIAILKTVDPSTIESIGGKKFIQVLGYNEAGDKPTVTYVWNPNSTAASDNGSIIQSSVTAAGRWELIRNFESLDVRHFNVFASNQAESIYEHRSKIASALSYASSYGFNLYFPAVNNGTNFYDIGGLSVVNPIVANNVQFVAGGDSISTTLISDEKTPVKIISEDEDVVFYVYGKELVTSQNALNDYRVQLFPYDSIIFDSDYQVEFQDEDDEIKFENVKVDFRSAQSANTKFRFVNCELNGRVIGNNSPVKVTFERCKISQELFDSRGVANVNVTFIDCTTDRTLWSSGEDWIVATHKINQQLEVDLQGMEISEDIAVYGDTIYRNGKFTGNIQITAGDLHLENCEVGSITFTSNNPSIFLRDCKISSFNFDANYANLTDSDDLKFLNDVEIYNCTIGSKVASGNNAFYGYVNGKFICEDSTIRFADWQEYSADKHRFNAMIDDKEVSIKDSIIYGKMAICSGNNLANVSIRYNQFKESNIAYFANKTNIVWNQVNVYSNSFVNSLDSLNSDAGNPFHIIKKGDGWTGTFSANQGAYNFYDNVSVLGYVTTMTTKYVPGTELKFDLRIPKNSVTFVNGSGTTASGTKKSFYDSDRNAGISFRHFFWNLGETTNRCDYGIDQIIIESMRVEFAQYTSYIDETETGRWVTWQSGNSGTHSGKVNAIVKVVTESYGRDSYQNELDHTWCPSFEDRTALGLVAYVTSWGGSATGAYECVQTGYPFNDLYHVKLACTIKLEKYRGNEYLNAEEI